MLFETQTIAPASSKSLADSVSGPPVISESMSKPVATIAFSPSTATSTIPTTRNSLRPTSDRTGISDDQRHQQHAFEQRQDPACPELEVVGKEQSEHDRHQDGADHGPTRLAHYIAGRRPNGCSRRTVVLHTGNLPLAARLLSGKPTAAPLVKRSARRASAPLPNGWAGSSVATGSWQHSSSLWSPCHSPKRPTRLPRN